MATKNTRIETPTEFHQLCKDATEAGYSVHGIIVPGCDEQFYSILRDNVIVLRAAEEHEVESFLANALAVTA